MTLGYENEASPEKIQSLQRSLKSEYDYWRFVAVGPHCFFLGLTKLPIRLIGQKSTNSPKDCQVNGHVHSNR